MAKVNTDTELSTNNMTEVYRDENIVIKREGEDYSLQTTSDRASLRKNRMTFNTFHFSINWAEETHSCVSFLV